MKHTLRQKSILVLLILMSYSSLVFAVTIKGRIKSENRKTALAFVNISIENTELGIMSNDDGYFEIDVEKLPVDLLISHIGYKTARIKIKKSTFQTIYLEPSVLQGEEIYVTVTRAVEGKTPIAFSTLTQEDIQNYYSTQDVPMILASKVGVYAYSESGNGTGYSYVSIRGFDQSRIAVMIDNVPLNDNESHQVYWVDHADILSEAKDVQIQRGVGNSLYGASAFGGSININTQIASESRELSFTSGFGSYNTKKYQIAFKSGKQFGDNISMRGRVSQLESDGYRDLHKSNQTSVSLGAEYRGVQITHQLRANIGYENVDLVWDGVYADDIDSRTERIKADNPYTDDFLQQIYSLNSHYRISESLLFSNTAYLVKGSGYYEVRKYERDYYSYNLDFGDSLLYNNVTDLTRRQWIMNQYGGIVPTLTYLKGRIRFDTGMELRQYEGYHFGEVSQFSDADLSQQFENNWFTYYEYTGRKVSATAFARINYKLLDELNIIADLQYQHHNWTLDQEKIGHASGYQLATNWNFLNPRFGIIYRLNPRISLFTNYSQAEKEPADNQIIEADDVWSEPIHAAAEKISDVEFGLSYGTNKVSVNVNAYYIAFNNEQLKDIDIDQEGEYDYYTADETVHSGLEVDINYQVFPTLNVNANMSMSKQYFVGGNYDGNELKNVPSLLANTGINYHPNSHLSVFSTFKIVGEQYLDDENQGRIPSYILLNSGINYRFDCYEISFKINNMTDVLYSTFGYGYEWDGYQAYYWPGATRNYYLSFQIIL